MPIRSRNAESQRPADWIDVLLKLPAGDVTKIFFVIASDDEKRRRFAELVEEKFPLGGAPPSADDVWRVVCQVDPSLREGQD